MQGTLKVMGREGHTETVWDTQDEQSVRDAERRYRELRTRNTVAFAIKEINGRREGERIEKFDPTDPAQKEVLITAPMQGG